MPRRGENIYYRKDGRWEGRHKIYIDISGKAKYKSVYGKSYTECKNKLIDLKKTIKSNDLTGNSKMTVKELFEFWLKNVEHKIKVSTYCFYYTTISNHILPYMAEVKICKINTSYIIKFMKDKFKNGRIDKKGGLSKKTVYDIMTIIKSTFKYATKKMGIFINVDFEEAIIHSEKNYKPKALSLNDQNTIENYINSYSNNYNCAIALSLYTGMRLGEICGLTKNDIDLENKTISINKTVQRVKNFNNVLAFKTRLVIDEPKTSNSKRLVPLPDCLVNYIQNIIKNKSEDEYIFSNHSKKPLEPRILQNNFKNILNKFKIKSHSFHSLRHTFATRFAEAGFDIKSLSEILGHSNINITLSSYVHSSFEMKKNYINKLYK